MAKKAEQTQIQQNVDGRLSAVSNTVIDDNFLPPAEELSKYREVSDEIIPWIMKRVENEQNARLEFNSNNMNLAKCDLKFRHVYDILALLLAFIVIICGICATLWLITKGYNVASTMFAGGTIAIMVYAILGKKKSGENKH